MLRGLRIGGGVFLTLCFVLLAYDMVQFVGSQGARWATTLDLVLPGAWVQTIETQANLTGTTWSNTNSRVLRPLVTGVPLWSLGLGAALLLRWLGRA